MDVISNVLHKVNNPIAIFSSRINKKIINKFLSNDSNINYSKIESGQINSEEWEELSKIIETLSEKEIYIDDTLENSMQDIILKDYMLKGYAVNQRRLEYLEKTIKLIDIANRIDERLEGNDAKEILKVIGDYSKALDLFI